MQVFFALAGESLDPSSCFGAESGSADQLIPIIIDKEKSAKRSDDKSAKRTDDKCGEKAALLFPCSAIASTKICSALEENSIQCKESCRIII